MSQNTCKTQRNETSYIPTVKLRLRQYALALFIANDRRRMDSPCADAGQEDGWAKKMDGLRRWMGAHDHHHHHHHVINRVLRRVISADDVLIICRECTGQSVRDDTGEDGWSWTTVKYGNAGIGLRNIVEMLAIRQWMGPLRWCQSSS